MNFFLCLLGCLGACVLIACSFLYLFAPDAAQRLLKSVGITLGMVLFVVLALGELLHAVSPAALILGVTAVSTLAHFIREHRLGHHERREGPRYAERTPIMPQRVAGEDEE